MLFEPDAEPSLKSWLVRTLEPICDADPGALSDYVLALLKHNLSEAELRKELSSQLDEFLEKDGPPFIDSLFKALHSKSFLPYSMADPRPSYPTAPSADGGIPIPLDGLISPAIPTEPRSARKRALDDDGGHPPAKGPRLSNDGQFSRYSNGHGDARSSGQWDNRAGRPEDYMRQGFQNGGMGVGRGMNGGMMNGRGGGYRAPDASRPMCRDYHIKGYCARGAVCKYSHGEEAVVPGQMIPNGGMPYMPMGFDGAQAPYDPNEARMDMRPHRGGMNGPGLFHRTPRPPIMSRNDDGTTGLHDRSGELPVIQDLTPQGAAEDAAAEQRPRPIATYAAPVGRLPHINGNPGPHGPMGGPMEVDMPGPMPVPMPMMNPMGPMFPPRAPRQMAAQPGTFNGARAPNFGGSEQHQPGGRPERRNDKTLVVEKIPQEKLSIEAVTGWFKKFGTVTNVAVDPSTAKALVSFDDHEAARSAWKAEDAVFGNRFVKVFWHRPMKGHGDAGSKALAASASLVANLTKAEEQALAAPVEKVAAPSPVARPGGPAPTPSKKPPTSAAASALAAKQQLLQSQIAEQKSLMSALESAGTPEEKKEIMARLRKLGEEMKAPTAPAADREKSERERLDKELELHAENELPEGGDATEDLKAQLARLKAEAASLGLPEASAEGGYPPAAGYRGGYRGRGRGRGYFRGGPARGGPPRGSMKLDNRPKKLLVKGASADGLQGIRDWYETTGQLDSVNALDGGDLLVTFKSRNAAEQGLAKGTNIPTVGPVQLSWFTGQPAAVPPASSSSLEKDDKMDGSGLAETESVVGTEALEGEHEEEAARGWGDDSDAMGML